MYTNIIDVILILYVCEACLLSCLVYVSIHIRRVSRLDAPATLALVSEACLLYMSHVSYM